MKKISLFLSLLLFCFISLSAQAPNWQWAIQAGGTSQDRGNDIARDNQGNTYIIGYFNAIATFGSIPLTSSGGNDIFVAKLDSYGIFQWAVKAGGTSNDEGLGIAVDNNSNVYITGYFTGTATFGATQLISSAFTDIFVARLDTNGNWLWARRAGGADQDHGDSIVADNQGNVYVSGFFFGTVSFGSIPLVSYGGWDIFAAKLDAGGNWLWATHAGGTSMSIEEGWGIALDSSANVCLTGNFSGTATFGSTPLIASGNNDIFAAKLSPSGSWLWAVKAGGTANDVGKAVATDSQGNIYITGSFSGTANWGAIPLTSYGGIDIFTAKLDPAGSWLWAVKAGGSGTEWGYDLAVDINGYPYITGYFNANAAFGSTILNCSGNYDIYAAKLNPSGTWLWAVQAGGTNIDCGYGIAVDTDTNVYLTGYFIQTAYFGGMPLNSGSSLSDVFIARLEALPPPPATILVMPLDGQPGVPSAGAEFVWQQSGYGPDSFFDVYMDINPAFPAAPQYSGNGSELYSGGFFTFNQAILLDEQAYYWYVRITNLISGLSSNSPVWSFITAPAPPPAPIPISPLTGASGMPPRYLELIWEQPGWVSGNSFFDVFLGTDPVGVSVYSGLGTELYNGINFTLPQTNLLAGTTYFWRVKVTEVPGGMQQDSRIETFRTGDDLTNERPRLVYPMNEQGVWFDGLILRWDTPQLRDFPPESTFDVFLSTSIVFGPIPIYSGPGLDDPHHPGEKCCPVPTLVADTQYFWKVRLNLNGSYDESLPWVFITDADDPPPPVPILLDPPNNAVKPRNSIPFKSEVPLPGFDILYEAKITGAQNGISYIVPGEQDPHDGEIELFALGFLEPGPYTWFVTATNPATGQYSESEIWNLTILPQPELISPPDMAMGIPVTGTRLIWDAPDYPADSFFDIYLDIEPGFPAPPVFTGTGTTDPLYPTQRYWDTSYLLPETVYFWIAVPVGDPLLTAHRSFMTGTLPPLPAPMLTAPANHAMYVSPVGLRLEWDCAFDPLLYPDSFFDVYLSTSPSFPEPPIYSGPIMPDPGNPNHYFYDPETMTVFTPTNYCWKVRVNSQGMIAESEIWDFVLSSLYPNNASNPNPPDGAINVPIDIGQLQWEYHQLPGYGTPDGFEVYYPADAPTYTWVPYARDSLFALPIPHQAYNGHPLRFKAIARNAYGSAENPQTWTFTTEPPPPPALMSPANFAANVPVEGLRLQWSFEPDGFIPPEGYYYEVYLWIPGRSSGAPIYSGPITFETGFDIVEYDVGYILEDVSEYRWSVKVGVNGYLAESEEWSFTTESTPPPAPVLLTPPDGGTDVPPQGAEISWMQNGTDPDSFFDIYVDVSLDFPSPPVYSGNGQELYSGGIFTFNQAILLDEQAYYWYVRVTNLISGLHTDSQINSFTTATSPLTTSIISGTIIPASPLFNPSGVTITCPGACIPATVNTTFSGTYSFTVYNGGSYTVTPLKTGFYFNPLSKYFANVQGNQTQNFYEISMVPNPVTNVYPPNGATNVPYDIGEIRWSYFQDPGFSPPTEFAVYMPADAPVPIGIVPYSRAWDMYLHLEDLPGDSATGKIVPRNAHGEGIDIYAWSWGIYRQGGSTGGGGGGGAGKKPVSIYPADGADYVYVNGKILKWGVEYFRQGIPADSFFDIYCDTDSTFTAPPVYSGTGLVNPLNEEQRYCLAPTFLPNTIYYWKIKLTLTSTGDWVESDISAFYTTGVPEPHPAPVLMSPSPGAENLPPEGVYLEFDQTPWEVQSFFDVFLDTNPAFPNPPVYSGTLAGARTYFQYHQAALLAQTPYYWFVRYSNFVDNWYADSLVRQFVTGQYVIPSSNISGTISSIHNVSACTVTCPQAVAPISVSTGYYGTFSFTVNNGLNPVVTPTKTGYYFTPAFRQFNSISANQTANFTMTSLKPNLASQPLPYYNATNISINLESLQFSYLQNPGYSLPDNFDVWFGPLDAMEPIVPLMYEGDMQYTVLIPPHLLPLQNGITYGWKVVPYNEGGGEAESITTWKFTTVPPPVPELLLPVNGANGIPPEDVTLFWQLPAGSYQVDSFFDIYCDPDPAFPNPPVFSGNLPLMRTYFEWHIAATLAQTPYYWYVRYSNFVDYWVSQVRSFTTAPSALPTSIISGTIIPASPLFNPSGVTLTCPGACVPATVNTTFSGTYSFTVYNGGNYTVTPVKVGFYFNPLTRSYTNVQGNISSQNFYQISARPNPAILPVPGIGAINVPVNLRWLSWTYIQEPAYSAPTGFNLYFPAANPVPIYVPYTGRDPVYTAEIPPLQYNTPYDWKVVPFNAEGYPDDIIIWTFTTGSAALPEPVLTILPGGVLSWQAVPGAESYNIYESADPYGVFILTDTTPGLSWADPDYPLSRAFYRVTALSTPIRRAEPVNRTEGK
jgi:hypothetical protein